MFNGRKEEASSEILAESEFWPALDVGEFQRMRAIPLQIGEALIKDALHYAKAAVEIELSAYVIQQKEQNGVTTAEEMAQILYKKAVFALAKGELLPEFATLSARELHDKRDYVVEKRLLQAEATQAIRAIKGKKRSGVHLI